MSGLVASEDGADGVDGALVVLIAHQQSDDAVVDAELVEGVGAGEEVHHHIVLRHQLVEEGHGLIVDAKAIGGVDGALHDVDHHQVERLQLGQPGLGGGCMVFAHTERPHCQSGLCQGVGHALRIAVLSYRHQGYFLSILQWQGLILVTKHGHCLIVELLFQHTVFAAIQFVEQESGRFRMVVIKSGAIFEL